MASNTEGMRIFRAKNASLPLPTAAKVRKRPTKSGTGLKSRIVGQEPAFKVGYQIVENQPDNGKLKNQFLTVEKGQAHTLTRRFTPKS